MGISRLKIRPKPLQNIMHNPPNNAEWMGPRNSLLKVHITEKAATLTIFTTHLRLRIHQNRESRSGRKSYEFFSSLLD